MVNYEVSDKRYKQIIGIVRNVADKLKNPNEVKRICSEKSNYLIIEGKKTDSWDDLGLINGYPALSVFFGELMNVFPDEDWNLIGHEYMIKIQEAMEKELISSLSIFRGICSIGMAAYSLSNNGTRYKKFTDSINEFIIEYAPDMIDKIILSHKDIKMNDYDVIQGLSGTGRYLLFFKDNPKIEQIIKKILKYMISLTNDINVFNHSVPNWYISVENQFIQSDKNMYSKGNFNFGMSHGITGPLSLMSIALIYNVEIEGQREAIQKIVSTIDSFKYMLGQAIFLPGRIKFEEFINGECMHNGERASWCYGSPGIARAIYLAGKALNNENYKKVAIDVLDSLCSLPEDLWVLKSPTFCHGYAGLLRITHCMYLDTGLEKFNNYSDKILNKLLSFYDENAPFGFFNIDIIDIQKDIQYKKFNSCGLLEGTVGVLLTILGVIEPNKTNWDSVFMIN